MPSNKVLEEKKAIVAGLVEKLSNSASGVLVDYKGINVEDDTKLRKELREKGVEYKVVKNTLLSKACDQVGFEDLKGVLEGMTAMAVCADDVVAPAKILCEYAKKNKNFVIKAGFVEGKVIDADAVKALAELPSKEILVATVLGTLNAPVTGLVTVLNGNIRGLACVLQAIVDKQSA